MARADDDAAAAGTGATCLIVPGLCCSGPGHWQVLWEATRRDCRRAELGDWDDPTPDIWAARLGIAVREAAGPCLLVAHSLGCHAVLFWAARAGAAAGRVVGALLVAPPDVERPDVDPRLLRFAPPPSGRLPFPALLVASHDDPYARFDRSRAMAEAWGAQLIDLGRAGHINAASDLGPWPYGQGLLDALIAGTAAAA